MTALSDQEEAHAVAEETDIMGGKASSLLRPHGDDKGGNSYATPVTSPATPASGTGADPTRRAAEITADRLVQEIFKDLHISLRQHQTLLSQQKVKSMKPASVSIHGPRRLTSTDHGKSMTNVKQVHGRETTGSGFSTATSSKDDVDGGPSSGESPSSDTEETQVKRLRDHPAVRSLHSSRARLHPMSVEQEEQLNIVLLKISKALDPNDFEEIKFLCSGKYGVPKAVLERLDTPLKLFTNLKERGIISPYNLLRLQSYLWHVERRDLQEMVVQFAQRLGNTLYFFLPPQQPGENLEQVTFHIEGKLSDFGRHDLEELRHSVSRLLMVPEEYVALSGIQPSHSFLLTFTVPCYPSESPITRLQKGQRELTALRVDRIMARGETFTFPEPASPKRKAPKSRWTVARKLWSRKSAAKAEVKPPDSDTSSDPDAVQDLLMHACDMEQIAEQSQLQALDAEEKLSEVTELANKSQRMAVYWRTIVYQAVDSERSKRTPTSGRFARN